jgi:hypothetical protein
MIGTNEPVPYDSGEVMSKHISHNGICIFAIRHIHRTRHQFNYLQIRTKQFYSRIKQINLEMLPLLPRHFYKH